MSFTLSEVVPWGRNHAEYVAMFGLSPADLQQRILGCGDGPASFNATLAARGGSIVSVDPIYGFTKDEIAGRIVATFDVVLEQTRNNREEFVWQEIASVEELGRIRLAAMREFLADFDHGRATGRYLVGALPQLPFSSQAFDLALCSHLLFLYSAQLSEDFHLAAIRELGRVAREVRIFPLLELGAKRSRHLDPVVATLQQEGCRVEIKQVPYQFQKGGNELLIVRSADF